jgi:hypothetical protein
VCVCALDREGLFEVGPGQVRAKSDGGDRSEGGRRGNRALSSFGVVNYIR